MSFAQDQRTFGMVAVSFSMTSMWHLGETICQSPAVPNKISLHMMLFHGGRKKFPKLGTGSRAGEQIMRMMRMMMMMIYIYIIYVIPNIISITIIIIIISSRWCLYLFRLPAPVMMTSVMAGTSVETCSKVPKRWAASSSKFAAENHCE